MADNDNSNQNPLEIVTNAVDAPPQAPLVGNLDTLWESIRLLGMKMSGQPYRHPGTLNIDGDLWESLGGALTTEATGLPVSQAKAADARNFANNQAMLIDKILASLPGGAGNDPRTRQTVQRIAGYIGQYGPVALQALKANLGEDDQAGPLGSIVGVLESAFDSFYGQIGPQAPAVSILAGAMDTAVPVENRSNRLEAYRHERYAPQNRSRLHGASAREDATFMALLASHNVSPLNIPNENALNIFNEVLNRGANGFGEATLNALAENNVSENTRSLLNSGTMQSAIRTFARNNAGGNVEVERALNSYANQIDIRSNLESALHRSGIKSLESANLLDDNSIDTIRSDVKRALNQAKAIDPHSEQTVALEDLNSRMDTYYNRQKSYRDLGGNLSASQIAQGIEEQRMINISEAAAPYRDTVTQDLQRSIALRNDIQRRSNDIGTIESLAKDNHWMELINSGKVNQPTADLLQQYFGSVGGAPSLHAQYTNFTNNLADAEKARLQTVLTGFQNAPDKQQFWNDNRHELAPLVDTAMGIYAAGQNYTAGLKDIEVALQATNSTIGGRPFSSTKDTGEFVNMLFQGEWGRVPASTYSQSLPAIASGMIRTGTNADQTLQYAGLAAKKAKEVGGDIVTSSIWGAEAALATRLFQREKGIADSHLASYTANAIGIAPGMMEGRILNALSANLDDENIKKIKDPRHKAIAEKIRQGETLSNDEIAIIGQEGEIMFQDMGFTPGAIDAALSVDYSDQWFAKQNAFNVAQYAMSVDRRENVEAGMDTASNYLFALNKERAAKDENLTRAFYEFAVRSTDVLDFSKKDQTKADFIQFLKDRGINTSEIRSISAAKLVTGFKNTAEGVAQENGMSSAAEFINAVKMGENLVQKTKEANIVAQAWSNAPKQEGTGFTAALAEINRNPNATLEDIIAAAITYNLGDDDKIQLAQQAAIASVFDNNISMAESVEKKEGAKETTQKVLLRLTDAFGGDSQKAYDLLSASADGLSPEQQDIINNAGISETDVQTAAWSVLSTQVDILKKIEKEPEQQDAQIKAKIEEQQKSVDKNKNLEAQAKAEGKSVEDLTKEGRGSRPDFPLWVQEVPKAVQDKASAT